MICNKCNKTNKKYYNYCVEEGQYLEDSTEKLSIERSQYKYCTVCSSEILADYNYCCNCGQVSEAISASSKNIIESININAYIGKSSNSKKQSSKKQEFNLNKLNFKNIDFKELLKTAGTSIGFSLLFSIILSGIFNSLIGEEPFKVESFIGMFILAHLPKVTVNSFYMSAELYMGIIALAIIPIISNYLASSIRNKKSNFINQKENILITSLIYTFMVIIVSGIIKVLIKDNLYIDVNFISLKLIVNSIIFSIIGNYMAQQKNKDDEMRIEDSIIKMSISTIFQGIILMYVLSVVLIIIVMNSYIDTIGTVLCSSILLSPILWGLGNLGSISIAFNGESILKYNILDFNIDGTNLIIYIIGVLAIVAVFYYLKGRKLSSLVSDNSYKYPLIFSGIYTIVTLIFINICKIVAGGEFTEFISVIRNMLNYMGLYIPNIDYYSTVSVSFSLITSLISIFIFSFIFISLGYKHKNRQQ